MVVYYGQACDAYGQVYKGGADVILKRGDQEVARCTIAGTLGTGVNFAVRVPYDGVVCKSKCTSAKVSAPMRR